MNGPENKQSVTELIYDFFYFYTYEYDQKNQLINIKDGGFTRKFMRDKYPFSIVDPFETQRNPGCSVKFQSDGHKKIMMQFRAALDHYKI